MSESTGATPTRDHDIFGNELGITAGERALLAHAGRIFLKKVLQVDTHSKKGDPTEPKTLVITSSRCYVLSHGASPKVEISFNFLRIHQIECTEKKLTFNLAGDPRPRLFHSARADSVQIIGLITAQLKNVFPITQLDLIIKTTFESDALRSSVGNLRDNLLSAMDRVDATTISGFLTSYGFLCDFFGVQFSHEIAWYMNNVYLAHGFRDLNLTDLDHLPQRDILPVMSTLRHNEFFEGVIDRSGKMAPEFIEELSFVLNTSQSVKKLELTNCALRPENLVRLSVALKNNPRTVLTHLDLSDNAMDDKSMESFGAALEALPHGLQHLKLANCKITTRGGSLLANSMKQNKNMLYTLVHFDLSGNPLGPDPQGALGFIQEPQTIATLNLSQCNLNFEFVAPVLNRGCQQHLSQLDLSGNAGKGKKGVHGASVGAGLQQFVKSAIAISSVNLSNCKLNGDVISALLEGLSVNPNITGFNLDVSNNDLGVSRDPQQLPKVLSRTNCLREINLSSSGLDTSMPDVVDAITTNSMLRHVFIGRNFNSKPPVRAAALKGLASLLQKEDCHIQSLCVDDSKLKEQTVIILNALDDNSSLRKLNISGNGMGNHGARSLAKTLLTNTCLKEVEWDRNETGPQGFSDVAAALEHNYTLQVMPLPLYDVSKAGKVEDSVQRIQTYLCRNHSDERLKVELAARHRHRLLTATQQSSVVSREVAQLEDLLEWAIGCHGNDHQDVVSGQQTKEQAYVVQKVADGLYSPQVESDQFESITRQVKELIHNFMDRMFTEQVEEPSEHMVTRSMKACPNLLSEQSQETLRSFVMHNQDRDYQYVKKAVAKKTAPEIINHISAINLDTAANISELLVEQILAKLDQANQKLLKLKKASKSSSQTPDTKVSRNFTFRVQEDQSPTKKKKRVRRPDNDEDEIDLPTTPLVTEGPTLQHLGKTRPKPARMQQSSRRRPQRPTVKPTVDTPIEEETTPKPAEKPPEPQPKPVKAKPLLPKMKSTEEPVTLTKYEAKPEERVEEIKVEEPKPVEVRPKEEVKPETVKLDKVKPEESKPDEAKIEEDKPVEVKVQDTKVEESESEESEEEEPDEKEADKRREMEAKRKEVKAKLADLKMEDLFKPKPTKTYNEPEETESSDEEEPKRSGSAAAKEDDGEEGAISSEPSPSPLGKQPSSSDAKEDEPSESSQSKANRLSDEFDQIIASTTSWVSELANGEDTDKPVEKKDEEKPAPSPSNMEAERKETPVEDGGDGGKSFEGKVEEPEIPVKRETPSPEKTAEVKPPVEKVVSESPQPEVKVPKVSPRPSPKPRGSEAQISVDGVKKEAAAEREKSTPTPDGEKRVKESPTPPLKKPKTKTPPPSPRTSVSIKEATKSNLAKVLGRKPEGNGEATSRLSRASDRGLSGEWEIVESPNVAKSSPEVARKPPPVASKPKPSAGETSEDQKPTSNNSSPKKVPGMVATVPIGELANVLKGVALKPASKDPPSSSAPPPSSGTRSGENTPPTARKSIPAPAPKPRPKPRPTKKAASAGDLLDGKPVEQEPNDTLV